jgi:zinc transport system ATP-binding protein
MCELVWDMGGKKLGKSVIEIEGLNISYDGQKILEDVDLSIHERDFIGVIGPNGGGKTTLLKAILGLIKPDSGKIRITGKTPAQGRKLIGYVPQYMVFDREFPISVWDVALMGRLSHGRHGIWYNNKDREAARKALEAVKMLEFRKRRIDDLSGGQKQRIFIARALASEPKILLLDEPTASVDVCIEMGIYELFAELNKKMAIVLVTHDITAISTHVKRLACLNRRIHVHDEPTLTKEMLEETYACPVDLIAHGLPHRVYEEHG